MSNDNLGFALTIIALILLIAGAGFMTGRQVERRYWKAAIPDQMAQLCLECSGIGR